MADIVRYSALSKTDKSFEEMFLELHRPFRDAHTLERNWLNKDTSHYMTEVKPMLQIIVIYSDIADRRIVINRLQGILWKDGMNIIPRATGTAWFARSVCIEAYDLNKDTAGGKEIFRGKTYDMILLLPGVEFQEHDTLLSLLKYPEQNRIIRLV